MAVTQVNLEHVDQHDLVALDRRPFRSLPDRFRSARMDQIELKFRGKDTCVRRMGDQRPAIAKTPRLDPLPEWAEWFLSLGRLGASFSAQPGSRHWVCITVPDRRFAASLVAAGAIMYAARQERASDLLERFADLEEGDALTWVDGNGDNTFGKFLRIEDGRIHYKNRIHGGWGTATHRPLEKAQSFWPSGWDEEFVGGKKLATYPEFVDGCLGASADNFLSVSTFDALLIGQKSLLLKDLEAPEFEADGAKGPLLSIVRPRDVLKKGQHSKSRLVSSAGDPEEVHTLKPEGPTILDGPQSYSRLRHAVNGKVAIAILDRWTPGSQDAAGDMLIDRMYASDEPTLEIGTPPKGIELLSWVMPV